MLSPVIQEALNKQINHEFYSSYFYLSVSAYFESLNLGGFAHWMRLQSQEEREHGMRLLDHLHDRNGQATFEAIAQPPIEFQSPAEAFQQALQHEDHVTKLSIGSTSCRWKRRTTQYRWSYSGLFQSRSKRRSKPVRYWIS